MGEAKFGAGRNQAHMMMMLTIGTGVGGGIVFRTYNVDTPAGGHPQTNATQRMKIENTGDITMTNDLSVGGELTVSNGLSIHGSSWFHIKATSTDNIAPEDGQLNVNLSQNITSPNETITFEYRTP